MYKDNFVIAVKADGKILREQKDVVVLPFGSEYALRLKNLSWVRAIINVFLDGENATPDGLVINAQQTVDLERFIRNGNLEQGNRFKFIERTAAVEEGRGVKAEDGLIRVEVKFEKPYAWFPTQYVWNWGWDHGTTYTCENRGGFLRANSVIHSSSGFLGDANSGSNFVSASSMNGSPQPTQNAQCNVLNEAGITVPGSVSDQKFSQVSEFSTESETHTLILRLVGRLQNKSVRKAVTVESKPVCVTCRKANKATSNYCSRCGTSLQII